MPPFAANRGKRPLPVRTAEEGPWLTRRRVAASTSSRKRGGAVEYRLPGHQVAVPGWWRTSQRPSGLKDGSQHPSSPERVVCPRPGSPAPPRRTAGRRDNVIEPVVVLDPGSEVAGRAAGTPPTARPRSGWRPNVVGGGQRLVRPMADEGVGIEQAVVEETSGASLRSLWPPTRSVAKLENAT